MTLLSIDPDTLEPLQAPLERLFRAYDADVRRVLRGMFRGVDADTHDDAIARTWLIAARCVHRLNFEGAGRWLAIVARNEMLALLEDQRKERAVECEDLERLIGHADDDVAAMLDTKARAAGILDVLRPRERRALVGRALGLTYEQLAVATGTTYTNVNKHVTRGRARARRSAYATP